MRKFFIIVLLVFSFPGQPASAHPGNTFADGCHYCWTNCAQWEEVYGVRHCHENKTEFTSAHVASTEYTEKSKLNIQQLLIGLSNETFCSQGILLLKSEIDEVFENMTLYDNLRIELEKGFGDRCIKDVQCSFYKTDLENAMKVLAEYLVFVSTAADKNCGTQYSTESANRLVKWANDQHAIREIEILKRDPVVDQPDIFQSDIALSPYKLAIANLKQKGIVGGYPDGTYKPKNMINRAEFMKIVIGAVGIPASGNNCYSDVKNDWFAGFACAAKQQEIATGYPDGTFKPNNNINVAEALKIALKAFAIPVRSLNDGEEWFKPYIEAANSNNFYVPTFDSPNKQITREEMAELINRVLIFQSTPAQ